MADVEQPEGEDRAIPTQVPQDSQEEEEVEEDRAEAEDQGDSPEPPEPTEPIDILFRGFHTMSQTLSEAYGHACGEIEIPSGRAWQRLPMGTGTWCSGPRGQFLPG